MQSPGVALQSPGTPSGNAPAHTSSVLGRALGVTLGGRRAPGALELARLAAELAQEHAEGAGSEGPASAADAAPSASDGAQLPPEASSAVLISRENLERVVLERLGLDAAALAEGMAAGASEQAPTPLQYLLGTYRRCLEEERSSERLKDKEYAAELCGTLAYLRELCVSYVGMLCQYPDMFPQPQAAAGAGALQLLDALTGEGRHTTVDQREQLPPGFLEAFCARFAEEGLAEMAAQLFEAMPRQVHPVSILGPFQGPLATLCRLAAMPELAPLLTANAAWSPPYRNGRELELKSIVGAFLRLSPLPDFWMVSAQPSVTESCYPSPSTLSQRDANAAHAQLRNIIGMLHAGLNELLRGLLKKKELRARTVGMLAECVKACHGRSKMRFNEMQEASHGFAFNLAGVLLLLCEPFLDASHSKRDRLDVSYVLGDARGLPFSKLTRLAASTDEMASWVDVRNLDHQEKFKAQQEERERRELEAQGLSAEEAAAVIAARASGDGAGPSTQPAAEKEYSFICECFFLTAEALHLGLIKIISMYNEEMKEAHRRRREMEAAQARQEGAPPDARLEALKAQCDRDMQRRLCFEAALLTPDVLSRALAFYRLMATWLQGLAGGKGDGEPLPVPPPNEYRAMPEHFVEDMAEVLIFVGQLMSYGWLRELGSERLDDFMEFLVMFSGSSLHLKNPYLRSKLVEVLAVWMPDAGDDEGRPQSRRQRRGQVRPPSFASGLFEAHPTAIRCLVPHLIKLYVQIEFTGSHGAFYEKFPIRSNMARLFDYLWTVPAHRATWKAYAAEESGEEGQYVGFINMLLNDLIFLLDEAMKKMVEIKQFEADRDNPQSELHSAPDEEREERESSYNQDIGYAKNDFSLAGEHLNLLRYTTSEITAAVLSESMVARVASTLNYFLLMLVDPTQRKTFRVKDPSKCGFYPEQLLGDIAQIYANISAADATGRFAQAVGTDERSFRAPLLLEAAALVRRFGTAPAEAADALERLRDTALEAVAEEEELDDILGDDVPDEYLDPLMGEIMRDPVKLPTSGNVMDRKHIARHLLSDESDPFNRKLLTPKMLEPMPKLKDEINKYIAEAKAKAKRAKTEATDMEE